MNVKNILPNCINNFKPFETTKGKVATGAAGLTGAAGTTAFLATKGVTALVAGNAAVAATGWGFIALAVAALVIALIGLIQAYRAREGATEEKNDQLNLQWVKRPNPLDDLKVNLNSGAQFKTPVKVRINPHVSPLDAAKRIIKDQYTVSHPGLAK